VFADAGQAGRTDGEQGANAGVPEDEAEDAPARESTMLSVNS